MQDPGPKLFERVISEIFFFSSTLPRYDLSQWFISAVLFGRMSQGLCIFLLHAYSYSSTLTPCCFVLTFFYKSDPFQKDYVPGIFFITRSPTSRVCQICFACEKTQLALQAWLPKDYWQPSVLSLEPPTEWISKAVQRHFFFNLGL